MATVAHRVHSVGRLAVSVFAGLLFGCGGGSGGPGPDLSLAGDGVLLVSITYPMSTDLSGATVTPPGEAPLSQQVVFTFSGPVEVPLAGEGIRIFAEAGLDYTGPSCALDDSRSLIAARGSFEVHGNTVVFTPFIPLGGIDLSPNADPDHVPGLLPGYTYAVFLPRGTKESIPNLAGIGSKVVHPGSFATLAPGRLSLAFANHPVLPPNVVSTEPPDGTVDFPVNTFDDLPGFPPNSDIILHLDQPLDMRTENLEGMDLDGDGVNDPNFFLGYSEPRLYCAADEAPGLPGFIAFLDTATDTFELAGFTEYNGTSVGLNSILFPREHGGEKPFRMVGCSGSKLYDVDYEHPMGSPPVCALSNERLLSAGTDVRGLTLDRKGQVLGLDGAGQSLLRIDTDTGAVEVLGPLPPGLGAFVDLCVSPENILYGLRNSNPGSPSAVCTIERIKVKTLETVVEVSGLQGDYASLGFSLADTAVLYDASAMRRVVLDLPSGMIIEYGLPVIDPNLKAGTPVDFDLKRFEIGLDPVLESNPLTGAKVRLEPTGLLPFGALVDVMVRYSLKNINGGSKATHHGKSALGAEPAATFRTFDPGTGAVEDRFLEEFLDNEMEETLHEFSEAKALWNVINPTYKVPFYEHLLAGLGQAGAGELGDFLPMGIFPIVILDTDCQHFPLLDGSTPGITKPTTVYGGEFHFNDIIIPEGVTVLGMGSNPLVLSATGRVEIGGIIDASGQDGTDDVTWNTGYLPVPGGPGGPGGGRGGMGQPPVPPDYKNVINLQSVPRGERGFGPGNAGPTGGEGGESGAEGPDVPWSGSHTSKKSRGAGGGGGTFLQAGHEGYPGKGQYGVDPNGAFYIRDPYYYWDGSYEYDPNWKPGDPFPPKLHEFFDTQHPHSGVPGDPVFKDADPNNDYIGSKGELKHLAGGQGGGGGGSRLDSMNPDAQFWYYPYKPPLPRCTFDAKGGGGGGGGGAVAIHSLGEIVVTKTGMILANGGTGGGGEVIGNSQSGGSGGGGSGGAILLDSAERIEIEHDGAELYGRLDVSGGWGGDAKETVTVNYSTIEEPCAISSYTGQLLHTYFCTWSRGDGGYGGYGLIQLMVPDPFDPAQLVLHEDSIKASYVEIDLYPNWPKSNGTTGFSYYHYDVVGSSPSYTQIFPMTTDCLVPPEKTPSPMGPLSYAVSKWINTGMAAHRPDIGGTGAPVFMDFEGIKAAGDWGVVNTTAQGHVVNAQIPDFNDIVVDAPDLALENFIPNDNEVAMQFQGTDAVYPGSKIPDEHPGAVSDWTWDLASLGGKQFIRFRIRFDVAKGGEVQVNSTKPQVNWFRVRMKY